MLLNTIFQNLYLINPYIIAISFIYIVRIILIVLKLII